MNHYFHSIPGRLRVRTPLLKSTAVKKGLDARLAGHDGIISVEHNPITGSVTMKYDTVRTNEKRLLGLLRDGGWFDPERAITNDQYVHRVVAKTTDIVSKAFCGSVVDSALAGTPLAALGLLI
jgi:hypothetical protein